MLSIVLNTIAITICGLLGAVVAWAAVRALGLDGVTGAIVMATLGAALAMLLWAAGVAIRNALSKH
jgi:hypothetical protein